jgi:SAM-dependent methyltransferase
VKAFSASSAVGSFRSGNLRDMEDELSRVMALGWRVPQRSDDGVRYTTPNRDSPVSYPDEGLDVLGLEGGTGYWFDHRAAAVSRLIRRSGVSSMWEVGSGTGAMARRLSPPLKSVVTVEPLAAGAQAAASLGLVSLCGTLEDLHLPDGSLECIGVFDVLEHLPSPGGLLDEVHRVIRPGGLVIATVPALPMLWGDEDDAAGHQRRYTKSSFAELLSGRGFTPIHTEYLYASLVAPAAVTRAVPYRLGKRRSQAVVLASMKSQLVVPTMVDRLARAVLSAETAIARRVPLPFGLSLLGAFRVR